MYVFDRLLRHILFHKMYSVQLLDCLLIHNSALYSTQYLVSDILYEVVSELELYEPINFYRIHQKIW